MAEHHGLEWTPPADALDVELASPTKIDAAAPTVDTVHPQVGLGSRRGT